LPQAEPTSRVEAGSASRRRRFPNSARFERAPWLRPGRVCEEGSPRPPPAGVRGPVVHGPC